MTKKTVLRSDLLAANLLLNEKVILNEEFGNTLLLIELETNVDPSKYLLEIFYKQPVFWGLLPQERTKRIVLSEKGVQDFVTSYTVSLNEKLKGQYPFMAKISSLNGIEHKDADFVLRYKLL